MNNIETYTFKTPTSKHSKRAMGRTMRHAVMTIVYEYSDGAMVTGTGNGEPAQTFRILGGVAEVIATPAAATVAPKATRKAAKRGPSTRVTVETVKAIEAPQAPVTLDLTAIAEASIRKFEAKPSYPAQQNRLEQWLGQRGYKLPVNVFGHIVKPAPVQAAPVIRAPIPMAKNSTPAEVEIRTVQLSKTPKAKAEPSHPVLSQAIVLAETAPDEFRAFLAVNGRAIAAEMGKPFKVASGGSWEAYLASKSDEYLLGAVREGLRTARAHTNEQTRKTRKGRAAAGFQAAASKVRPAIVAINGSGKGKGYQVTELPTAELFAAVKSATNGGSLRIFDGSRSGELPDATIPIATLKRVGTLIPSWHSFSVYYSVKFGLVVKYVGKHGNRGQLLLDSGPSAIDENDYVIAFNTAVQSKTG